MPLLFSKQINPTTSYAIWNIQETNEQLIEQFNSMFPEDLHPTKLAEWLVTNIMLDQVCQSFGIKFTGLTKNDAGKPFLNGNTAQISISHSFPMAAVLINRNRVCGIDLERQRSALIKIQHKFLHKSELQYQNDLERLCAIWCAKEVLYKIHGRKKLSLKDELCVEFRSDDLISGYILKGGFEETYQIHYESVRDYFMAYNI